MKRIRLVVAFVLAAAAGLSAGAYAGQGKGASQVAKPQPTEIACNVCCTGGCHGNELCIFACHAQCGCAAE